MAFRTATTGLPGPVFLEMPIDQLFDSYEMEKICFPTDYRSEAGMAGDPRYIEKALAAIKGAAKPVALVGTQLRWSVRREAYPEFARTFGMPIYVNGLGRGSLPPEDPHFFSRTRKQALKQADVVLIFGTPLDFRIGYGRDSHINPDATLIQVDLDPRELGRNRPCNIGIVGDTGLVMEQLTQAARAEGYSAAMVKPWLDDMRTRERAELEKVQPRARRRRRPGQSAAGVQGDRRFGRARTRSSSATAATSSPPRRRSCASTSRDTGSIQARSARSASAPGTRWPPSSRSPTRR